MLKHLQNFNNGHLNEAEGFRPYNEAVFKANNRTEVDYIVNYVQGRGYKHFRHREIEVAEPDNYPIHFFTEFKDNNLTWILNNDDEQIINYISRSNEGADSDSNINPKLFNYKDIKQLDLIEKTGDGIVVPNYTPRKMIREAFNSRYNYNSIVIGIIKDDDLPKIEEILVDFYKRNGLDYDYPSNFIKRNKHDLYAGEYLRMDRNNLFRKGDIRGIDRYAAENQFTYEKVFTLEDLENGILDNIFKSGSSKKPIPTYTPRKIDRTLERSEYSTIIPIVVYCPTVEDCLNFERHIHGLGYIYRGNIANYIIRDRFNGMTGLTFFEFEKTDKTMNVRTGIRDDDTEKKFIYPKDKAIIDTYFGIKPTYTPRKIDRTLERSSSVERLDEAFNFLSNEDDLLKYDSRPKFTLGQKTRLKKDGLEIHLKNIFGRYGESDNTKEWITSQIGRTLTVIGFVHDPDWNNLWLVECKDEDGGTNYIQQDALIPNTPTYLPRKMDRTLESYNTPMNIKESKYFKEYNTLAFSVTMDDKYEEVFNFLSKLENVFQSGMDRSTIRYILTEAMVEPQYVRMTAEMYGGFDWGYARSEMFSTFAKKEGRTYKRLFSYKEISNNLEAILKYGDIIPSYMPRRVDRTLEKVNLDKYEYGSICFQVKNKEEVVKVIDLFYDKYDIQKQIREAKEDAISDILYTYSEIVAWGEYTVPFVDTVFVVSFVDSSFFIIPKDHMDLYVSGEYALNPEILTIEDLKKWSDDVPSYKPRRVDRTLESIDDSSYKTVVFKTSNEEEGRVCQEQLFKHGYKWEYNLKPEFRGFDKNDYPVYLFAEITYDKIIEHMRENNCTEYGGIMGYMKVCIDGGEKMVNKVFNYDQAMHLDLILKTGTAIPSYTPRRIDRTLENLNEGRDNYPYDSIVVKVENREELDELNKRLSSMGKLESYLERSMTMFPNWVFIRLYPYYEENKFILSYLTNRLVNVERCLKDYILEDEDVNSTIYSLSTSDWKRVESILKFGKEIIEPSYKPRRIVRENKDYMSSSEILIRVNDIDELMIVIRLFDNNDFYNEELFRNLRSLTSQRDFPVYLFVNLKTRVIFVQRHSNYDKDDAYMSYLDPIDTYEHIYTIKNDLTDITKMLEKKIIIPFAPNYRPRHMDRTLESVKYKYDIIIFEAFDNTQTTYIQEQLIKQGYRWNSIGFKVKDFDSSHSFPIYLFAKENGKSITYMSPHELRSYGEISDYIKHYNTSRNACPSVFDYKSSNNVEQLLLWGVVGPSYTPRKIDRTLESVVNTEKIVILGNLYQYDMIGYKTDSIEDGKGPDELKEMFPFLVFPSSNLNPNVTYFFTIRKNDEFEQFHIYSAGREYSSKKVEENFPGITCYPKIVTSFDEMVHILKEIFKEKPNYTPRKMIRESLDEGYLPFRVWCDDKEKSIAFEEYLCDKIGWRWDTDDPTDRLIRADDNDTDCNTFCNFDKSKKTFDTYGSYNAQGYIVYNYPEDLAIFKNEFLSRPSYEPRRIDRTLEANDWYPYRMKTEEEMVRDFGQYWQTNLHCGWNHIMRDILGRDFPKKNIDITDLDPNSYLHADFPGIGGWTVMPSMMVKNIPMTPNYKPKRMDRTLESVVNKYEFDYVVVKVESRADIDKINEELKNISKDFLNNFDFDIDYPNWVFIKPNKLNSGGYTAITIWDTYSNERGVVQHVRQNDLVDPHIYTMSELSDVKLIIIRSGDSPSYTPRKMDRTLEGTQWYPYRFKTDEELTRDYGTDWRYEAFGGVGWNDDMYYLLGKDFPYQLHELDLDNRTRRHADDRLPLGRGESNQPIRYHDDRGINWLICWDMLTKNKPNIPSYKPKKIDRNI